MDKDKECCCGGVKLIFPCSGSADVGAIADQAARKLTREGAGRMACLAGIGGGVSGILKSVEAAEKILVIDGCPLECAKKTMEKAGFSSFKHLRLAELGFEKGKSPVNDENIAKVVLAGTDTLRA
jgi:uncharacterized metal-binding protein